MMEWIGTALEVFGITVGVLIGVSLLLIAVIVIIFARAQARGENPFR